MRRQRGVVAGRPYEGGSRSPLADRIAWRRVRVGVVRSCFCRAAGREWLGADDRAKPASALTPPEALRRGEPHAGSGALIEIWRVARPRRPDHDRLIVPQDGGRCRSPGRDPRRTRRPRSGHLSPSAGPSRARVDIPVDRDLRSYWCGPPVEVKVAKSARANALATGRRAAERERWRIGQARRECRGVGQGLPQQRRGLDLQRIARAARAARGSHRPHVAPAQRNAGSAT
jgi:hypothetical protein